MGTGRPASAAGHAEPPAASLDEAVVQPSPGRRSKRAGRLLLVGHLVQRRRHAARPLEGQEAVGQEAQRRMVVEAWPGTTLKVVQPQFFLELLVALLHLPTRFPQADRLLHVALAGRLDSA